MKKAFDVNMRSVSQHVLLAAAVGVLFMAPAGAAEYPARPVRLVVPFPPGGGSDVIARTDGAELGQRLNQAFVIDNRPGAGGILGTDIVAKAAADGHTLLLASGSHSINAALRDKLPYDAISSFSPISRLALIPNVLVVHPSVPAKSVQEFIALASRRPGQMNYASAGSGSTLHLAMELLKAIAGIDLKHVPYKGASPAEIDLVAGRVQAMFGTIPATVPQIRTGKLRALAVSSARRTPLMPGLPTVAESGVAGFAVDSWYALMGPRGVPASVVESLNRQVQDVLRAPAVRERFAVTGADAIGSSPKELLQFVSAEIAKWNDIGRRAGIRLD
jgi:tripartite-type tricarboxylate transporter receptor subunit TctC